MTGKKTNCAVTKMLKPFFVVCYISTLRLLKLRDKTFLKNTQSNEEISEALKQR